MSGGRAARERMRDEAQSSRLPRWYLGEGEGCKIIRTLEEGDWAAVLRLSGDDEEIPSRALEVTVVAKFPRVQVERARSVSAFGAVVVGRGTPKPYRRIEWQ